MTTKLSALSMMLMSTLALTSACDAPEQAPDVAEDVQLRPGGGTGGGVWLNTSYMNVDEIDTTKILHDGVTLQSVEIKVANKLKKLDSVWVVDGQMYGKIGATTYSGSAFLNAEMKVFNQQYSSVVTVWITSYTPGTGGAPPSYQLKQSYFNNQVVYVCNREDSVGPYESYIFGNLTVGDTTGDVTDRPNTLYLGCQKGAVGKAGTWGYLPWDIGTADFEAMVRVVRADYCGDGVSHTVPGKAVTLKDVWGINDFATQATTTEAVWGPNGALCLDTPRDSTVTASSIVCNGAPLPACPVGVDLTSYPDALMWVKNVSSV